MSQLLDRAIAAANLLNIGFDAQSTFEIVEDWRRRQAELSLTSIASYARSISTIDQICVEAAGRLFVTFHYSSYSHLFYAIAQRSRERKIFSLIGAQHSSHSEALGKLALEFGFEIQFVAGGPSMVKTMRNALREGHAGMILLDVPWSKDKSEPDVRFDTKIGSFRTLATILRLIKLIDPDYAVIYCQTCNQELFLRGVNDHDFGEAFSTLANLILEKPWEYERLNQLHKVCDLAYRQDVRIYFSVSDQRFALDARTMKFFKVNRSSTETLAKYDDFEIEYYG